MNPPYVELLVRQGDTFRRPLAVELKNEKTPVDLAGCTVTFHLRIPDAPDDTLTVPLTIIDAAAGMTSLLLTAAQTAEMPAGATYTYEVELIDPVGDITTLVEGVLNVDRDRG